MQGKRRDLTESNDVLDAGEFGRHWHNNQWYCCPPNHLGLVGNLTSHDVIEHEDGTITVTPSILIRKPHTGEEWHGYIERGIWREV